MGMVPPSLDNPHDPDFQVADSPMAGLYWPVLVIILTLLIWFGFQLSQILGERRNLSNVSAAQDSLIHRSTRMRTTMDALADGAFRLSAGGNANAKRFIDNMAKRGITFNPPKGDFVKPSHTEETPAK